MLGTKYTSAGWLLLLIVVITSCTSSAPKQTKYIPKDASVVFSINPKKLSDKLGDSKVNLDSLMRSAFSSDTSMMITANDMANSGIDLTKDIFLFVNQAGSMMSGSSITTGVVAAMDKTSAFEEFLKKKVPSAQIKKEKDFSYAVLKDNSVVGWNDDVVLAENISGGYNIQSGEPTSVAPGAAQQSLVSLFSLKEDVSLASLKQFKDANDGKADMFFWSNSNGSLSSIPMIGMSKASDLIKDTYSSGAINFENGKVVMDMKTYPNEMLKDTLKKYAGPKVDMDLVNKYPGAVNGYAVFSFDPRLIVSILNFMGVTQTANQFLANQGYTLEDITKAFKGDFAVIFSNVGNEQKEIQGYKYSSPTAKLIIDAAIGDKASYDKITAQLAKQGILVMKNGQYQPSMMEGEGAPGFKMHTDAKNIVFASDSVLLQQYVAGSGKVSLPNDVSSQTKGTAVAFYVDITSILNAVPTDSSDAEMMTSAKQTFKDVIATSDNYSDGVMKGHAELRTINEKENSLATLTRYFGSLAETMKKMKGAAGLSDAEMAPQTGTLPDTTVPMSVDTTGQ